MIWSHAFGQSTNRLRLDGSHVVNVTQTKKLPERLFDNDLTTRLDPDFVVYPSLNPFVFWVVLDSTYNDVKIDYFHTTGTSNWIVRVYSDNWDTAAADKRQFTFTGVFNDTATVSQTDTVSFPIRLLRFETAVFSSGVTELFIYGDAVSNGSTYLPTPGIWPSDPGKYFYGFSDLYPNQTYDDVGWSVRWMGYTHYVDTSLYTPWNAHTYVFSKFQNDLTDKWGPTTLAGRTIHPYYTGPSIAFRYSPGNEEHSKDIPIGYDSLDEVSWTNVYRLAAAAVTHFDLDYYEIGNEDAAWWVDNLRYHSPAVLLTKWKAGAAGARSANPLVKVIGGPQPFVDTSYLKAMYLLNKFSGDPWPVDAIAINDYNTNAGGQHISTSDGVSPEQGRVFTKWSLLKTLVEGRFPGNEVQQMEFGYDTASSPYNVRTIEGTYKEKTKAQWNMRHWLWLASAQMHRGFLYTNRHQGGVDFGTTGWEAVVEDPPTVFTTVPTDSYYYYATFANEIAGYNAWPTVMVNGDSSGVSVFRYTHASNADSVLYAVVRGTTVGGYQVNYKLHLGAYTTGDVIRSVLSAPLRRGTQTTITPSVNTVTIPLVDETVTFIRMKKNPYRPRYGSRYTY